MTKIFSVIYNLIFLSSHELAVVFINPNWKLHADWWTCGAFLQGQNVGVLSTTLFPSMTGTKSCDQNIRWTKRVSKEKTKRKKKVYPFFTWILEEKMWVNDITFVFIFIHMQWIFYLLVWFKRRSWLDWTEKKECFTIKKKRKHGFTLVK